eukprot:1842682-Amphidinium_carterae.1
MPLCDVAVRVPQRRGSTYVLHIIWCSSYVWNTPLKKYPPLSSIVVSRALAGASLNVAVAAAVCVFELTSSSDAPKALCRLGAHTSNEAAKVTWWMLFC